MPDRNPKYIFWIVCVYLLSSFPDVWPVEDPTRRHYPFSLYSFSREWEKEFCVIYDPYRHVYLVYDCRIYSGFQIPLLLTPAEYTLWRSRLFQQRYFRSKNSIFSSTETVPGAGYSPYTLPGRRKKEPLFGSGGFRYSLQGNVEVSVGMKRSYVGNPLQTERNRRPTWFDFNEKIRMNFQAEMGSKFRMDMSYHTEPLFEEDKGRIKITYTGEEDEFIRLIEAGQVGLTTHNSLIRGETGLFGIKADFQFGKLFLNTVVAQQEKEVRKETGRQVVRKREFDIPVTQYDENQHFFLSHYFYELYNHALLRLPYIASPVLINRVEVWVTNKTRDFQQSRNVVAFTDLAEQSVIHHPHIVPDPANSLDIPFNRVNNLYELLISVYPDVRRIQRVNQSLKGFLENGVHFEKIESARLLQPSEYFFHEQLGYISLFQPLSPDEVLGVAFEFSYKGQVYQVGEFSTDQTGSISDCLFVKLLKGSILSPVIPTWQLMMKNVYSLPVTSFRKEEFKMDVLFLYDSTGTYVSHLPEGKKKNESFLSLLGVDRLDNQLNNRPDDAFDLVEGYTVFSDRGKIAFPTVEPFGRDLYTSINEEAIASKYTFQELYDSTTTFVRLLTEKKKFVLKGEYTGEGSVQEGTPWGNVPVAGIQQRMLAGFEMNYQYSRQLMAGFTVLHLSERPSGNKIQPGQEAIRNTLWGVHLNYQTENRTFTKWLNKFSYQDWSLPVLLSWKSEFAYLQAGHRVNKEVGDYVWLDDFESAKGSFLLSDPAAWHLSSTPWREVHPLFPEASLVNDISYGKNRGLLAWYIIDPLLTGKSGTAPSHLRNDKEQLSNHSVREVSYQELFPARSYSYAQTTRLPIFNIAFYPNERGPYNLDAEGMNSEGKLMYPEKRWGGMMRTIEWTNFEAANIETIEFWLMDPYIYDRENPGGDLYLNLGDLPEDVLKDERKFFENGLPVDGDPSQVEITVWGKVPRQQNTAYAFENDPQARKMQDVGLNGLSSEEEKCFPAYQTYLEKVLQTISAETRQQWEKDPLSPIHDPAGDNFHHFRGSDYDAAETDILTRYKRYNGTEGNSCLPTESPERYDIAAKYAPDSEDINQDNTLNELEKYYEYKISLRPEDLKPGMNYVTGSRTATVQLENGNTEEVTWYQFKVPIRQYNNRVGNITDFTSIRFMRLYLTGFSGQVVLRMASFGLIRGEWRVYDQPVSDSSLSVFDEATVEVSVVNLEEDGERSPVNYVLPPDVERVTDPSQTQLIRRNEQSLAVRIKELEPHDSKAVCREVSHDLRLYERLQLFIHAEAFPEDHTLLADDELSLFLRLGTDYRNNYYEYEVPLLLTPAGLYNSSSLEDRRKVWPSENQLDIPLSLFTDLKMKRNRLISGSPGSMDFRTVFEDPDVDRPRNLVAIRGNPSLSDISVLMIGVRNRSDAGKQIEIWVNELRLTGCEDQGGWAMKNNLQMQLSDLGFLSVGTHFESVGFGSLDQARAERRMEEYVRYSFAASLQLGKLFPSSLHIRIPFSYAWSKERTIPLYNPFNRDILVSRSLQELQTQQEKDSLRWLVKENSITKSIGFNGVNIGIRSRSPMPYDPANFTFGYLYSEVNRREPETVYEHSRRHFASIDYVYEPDSRSLSPFKRRKKGGYVNQLEFFFLPAHLSFSSTISRYYYEIEKRFPGTLSFIQDFSWKRSFVLRWNLTRHLQASFQSGTNARIEEPHMQVNKKLDPDGYRVWKDSVRHSLLHLGRPLLYDQQFTAHYTFPFSLIPVINWMHGTLGYQAKYTWEKSGDQSGSYQTGNTIQNQRTLKYQAISNVQSLYNKNTRLRRINHSFRLGRNENGERSSFTDYLIRICMLVRRLHVSYEQIDGMTFSGFSPEVGDLLGQKRVQGNWAPGLKFAFGAVEKNYINELLDRGWLIVGEEHVTPALINNSTRWVFQGMLEPFPGLKIELTTDHLHTRTSRIDYTLSGMPERKGGSFTGNVVAVRTALKKTGLADTHFDSAPYRRFLENRLVIGERNEDRFAALSYPNTGFLSGSSYAGQPYRRESVRWQSAEVLIPAFLSAYQGTDPQQISLSYFPSLASLLPNWKVVYDGLVELPFLKKYFRTIQLSHQYRGVYNVLNYTTRLNWVQGEGDLGFIPASQADSTPIPAYPWQVSSVTLTDGFTPLAGVDVTLQNYFTFGLHYHKTRNLNLSITSLQLNEHHTQEYIFGFGYRTMDVHKTFPRLRKPRDPHELNVRIDFTYRKNCFLLRKIENNFTQLISGSNHITFHLLAEYGFTRDITFKFFFDLQKEDPLLSEISYPSTTTQGGFSLLLSLNRSKK